MSMPKNSRTARFFSQLSKMEGDRILADTIAHKAGAAQPDIAESCKVPLTGIKRKTK